MKRDVVNRSCDIRTDALLSMALFAARGREREKEVGGYAANLIGSY